MLNSPATQRPLCCGKLKLSWETLEDMKSYRERKKAKEHHSARHMSEEAILEVAPPAPAAPADALWVGDESPIQIRPKFLTYTSE